MKLRSERDLLDQTLGRCRGEGAEIRHSQVKSVTSRSLFGKPPLIKTLNLSTIGDEMTSGFVIEPLVDTTRPLLYNDTYD